MKKYLRSSLLVAVGFTGGIVYLLSCGGGGGGGSVSGIAGGPSGTTDAYAQQATLAPELDPAKIVGGTFRLGTATNNFGHTNPTTVACPSISSTNLSGQVINAGGATPACFDLGTGPLVLTHINPLPLPIIGVTVSTAFWAGPDANTARVFVTAYANNTYGIVTRHARMVVQAGEHLYASVVTSGGYDSAVQWSGFKF